MIQRFCSLSRSDKCVVELIVFGFKCAVVDFLMRCRSAGTYAWCMSAGTTSDDTGSLAVYIARKRSDGDWFIDCYIFVFT